MEAHTLWAIVIIILSLSSVTLWLGAIFFVGLKLAAANGTYRLLALLLGLCIILTAQSVGLLYSGFYWAETSDPSWPLRLGTAWARITSIICAGIVLWYGRPERLQGGE